MADARCPVCNYLLSEHRIAVWKTAAVPASEDGKTQASPSKTVYTVLGPQPQVVPCFNGVRPLLADGSEVPLA